MPELSLMIKPASSRCQMRCDYCFYFDEAATRESLDYGFMSLETLEVVIRRAVAFAEGGLHLIFQGGEPTLRGLEYFQAVRELERRYNSKGLQITHAIQTNGYDLSDELLDFLHREDYLFGLSLDGTAEIHDLNRKDAQGQGTSSRAHELIGRFVERGTNFNILSVVTEPMTRDVQGVFEALSPFGYLQFIPCMAPLAGTDAGTESEAEGATPTAAPEGAAAPHNALSPRAYGRFLVELFDLYAASYAKGEPVSMRRFDNYLRILWDFPMHDCFMAGSCAPSFVIEGDGSVYPCDFYALDSFRLGNIHDASFFKLAKSPVLHHFLTTSLQKPAACASCDYFDLCRGGCRRDRLQRYADGREELGENRWCGSYRYFFERRGETLLELARSVPV